jgi:hypothetical protein
LAALYLEAEARPPDPQFLAKFKDVMGSCFLLSKRPDVFLKAITPFVFCLDTKPL